MLKRTPLLAIVALAALCSLTLPARAQDKTAKAAIPADVRARVVSKLQGATAADVAATPVPGIYEVTMGAVIAYVTADGKYLFTGNVYDLDTQSNLTAARRNAARSKALAAVKEDDTIVFSPPNPKMTVTCLHRRRLRVLPQVPQPDRRLQQRRDQGAVHDVSAHGPGDVIVAQGRIGAVLDGPQGRPDEGEARRGDQEQGLR
jgi:hypothetical protein